MSALKAWHQTFVYCTWYDVGCIAASTFFSFRAARSLLYTGKNEWTKLGKLRQWRACFKDAAPVRRSNCRRYGPTLAF